MASTLEELDKNAIAAVDGYCVGDGLEITSAGTMQMPEEPRP